MGTEQTNWATEEFVLRLKNKDKKAFEELLHHFGPHLLNFGMKMCRQKEDALDIFQDTLEKAYSSLSQLKEPQAIKTWLFRVAANACLMKRRKPLNAAEEVPLELIEPDRDALEHETSWNALPEKVMENSELREKLKNAVLSLPENYRSVLLLRDMEGFSTEETAEIMGLSKDVVKMRLLRARAKVREALAGFFH